MDDFSQEDMVVDAAFELGGGRLKGLPKRAHELYESWERTPTSTNREALRLALCSLIDASGSQWISMACTATYLDVVRQTLTRQRKNWGGVENDDWKKVASRARNPPVVYRYEWVRQVRDRRAVQREEMEALSARGQSVKDAIHAGVGAFIKKYPVVITKEGAPQEIAQMLNDWGRVQHFEAEGEKVLWMSMDEALTKWTWVSPSMRDEYDSIYRQVLAGVIRALDDAKSETLLKAELPAGAPRRRSRPL